MHRDAVASGDRVLIVDDVLATGGTAQGAARLVRDRGRVWGSVSSSSLISYAAGRSFNRSGVRPLLSLHVSSLVLKLSCSGTTPL